MLEPEKLRQQYQCCDEELWNAILKGHADNSLNNNEQQLLRVIKRLVVIPVSVVVRRYNFLRSR